MGESRYDSASVNLLTRIGEKKRHAVYGMSFSKTLKVFEMHQPQLPDEHDPELQPPPPPNGLVGAIVKPERGPASV